MDPVEEIRSRLDIAEVVKDYVSLKRSGKSFKGLCPFHKEKTPSFIVSPDKQLAYCFGCNKGGDIFTFVQLLEGIEFPQALELLAKRAGVNLPKQSPGLQDRKTRLFEMQQLAAAHFEQQLWQSEAGKPALSYLAKRGIKPETIKAFQLGYAPPDNQGCQNLLTKKGFRLPEIEEAGLIIKGKHGYFDRFRGRLMFPLTNAAGMIIGFTGRASSQTKGPKYLNSPETPIYDKGSILYGLDKAKNNIREQAEVVIVEGNMDVLAVYQAGTKNVVASSGTALTTNQLLLVARYAQQLLFSFDTDGAGQQAALRGIELALAEGLAVKVVKVLAGKDPDQCIREHPELWQKSLAQAQDYLDYCQDQVFAQHDLKTARGKTAAAKEMLTHISKLASAVEQDHYLKRLAKDLGVEAAALREDMDQLKLVKSGKLAPRSKAATTGQTKKAGYRKEHVLMGLLLAEPRLITVFAELLPQEQHFSANFWRLWLKLSQADEQLLKFWQELEAEQIQRLRLLNFVIEQRYQAMPFEAKQQELRLLVAQIAAEKQKGKIVRLAELLKQAEQQKDEAEGERIAAEMNQVLQTKD